MLRVTVDEKIRVEGPEGTLDKLAARLTFKNPEIKKAERLGLSTYGIEPEIETFEFEGRALVAPRGVALIVSRLAREQGLQVEWNSRATTNISKPRSIDSLNIELRPYQLECVERMLSVPQGIVELPCGGGKTTIGSAAILATGASALVLVHTVDLARGWMATLERLSGVTPRYVTSEGLSALAPGEVAVSLVQRLARAGDDALPLLRSAGVLVADECHHLPSLTWGEVANQCPARIRWGLTATLSRGDGLDFLFEVMVGSVIYRKTARELIDLGYLKRPLVVPIETGWTPDESCFRQFYVCPKCGKAAKPRKAGKAPSKCRACNEKIGPGNLSVRLDYGKALSARGKAHWRCELISQLVRIGTYNGRTAMTLVASKVQGKAIAQCVRDLGSTSAFVSSATPGAERASLIDSLGSGLSHLAATSLADEGLDVVELDWLVNDAAGKSKGRSKQRAGRACRLGGATVPIIVEPIDDHRVFRSQWAKRRRSYVEEYGDAAIYSRQPLPYEDGVEVLSTLARQIELPISG